MKLGDQPAWITDLDGIGGEIAAARFFGVYPDTETDLTELPDYDLITKKGRTVDVKTTKYENGRLLATRKKSGSPCDLYVLCVGVFPAYRLVGWAKGAELFDDANLIDLGHGKGDGLDQEKLRAF